jgi:hypothetical protein
MLLFSSGCTRLGPTPAMTGVPITPAQRPSFELQGGVVPGYYLSTTVQDEHESAALPQLLALLEPDELIHVPGLYVAARTAGEPETGAALEPLVGYRTFVDADERFSVMGVGFFAYATGEEKFASFSALRGGVEAGLDARVTPVSRYLELHANLGANLTGLDADGSYCVGVDRLGGVDCPDDPAQRSLVTASASGFYPSGHAGLTLELGRHLKNFFHGARIGVDFAGGTMPTLQGGRQQGSTWYGAAGLALTLGVGASSRRTAERVTAP